VLIESKEMVERTMHEVKMIVTNRFDPDVRVYKEAKYLVSCGFDVEILCWDREGEYKDKEFENIEGIKIKRFFPYTKYGTGLKQIKPFMKFIYECRNYLNSKEYQYLHCHDLDGALVGYLCKSKKCKLIFDMHEFYEGQRNKQKIRLIIRKAVSYLQNKSDFIIYVNEAQIEHMKLKNKNKLVYLPNYAEIDNYRDCEKEKSDKLRISYIGSVRQYEELKNLMDAGKDVNNVVISIHGSGTAYTALKSIENDYKNVNITGLYHFSKSVELYRKTDLLYVVFNTKFRNWKYGYSVKFFEAIITKTPVIVSRGSAMEEFVNKYDIGFTIDGSNIQEIKELIVYISENRHLLDEKIKNLEKIQYEFTWERVIKNLNKIYDLH